MQEPVFGLAIGVLVGGVLQLAVQIKPLLNIGILFQRPSTLRHPGAQKIGKLLVPRIMGSGVYQLTVLIDSFCASLSSIVGAGGISAIFYANSIIQFPMGIFSIALASAVLPTLSGLAVKKDMDSIKKTIVFSLENIFFVMCPTRIILLLLSSPIIRILFERGEFNPYSTHITSAALSFYALGLFSFGGIKILVSAFHALQDTKTPVKVAVICLCINAVLNFILMRPYKVGGIALASSIAGTIDFLALFYIMDKKLGGLNSNLFVYFLRVFIASFIIGVMGYLCWKHINISHEMVKLCVFSMVGIFLYGGLCLILQIEQAKKVWSWMSKRKK
jgi:putative peptidoglycan lipid II flippase